MSTLGEKKSSPLQACQDHPLEKAMAPHFSTFAWKIPWTEGPGRLQSMGSLESDTTERLHFHFSLSCTGEGMATQSSVLAWRIPRTEEPGGLPSLGSHRVVHDWSDLAAAAAARSSPVPTYFLYIWFCCNKNRNEWTAFGMESAKRPTKGKWTWLFFSCYY